MNRKMGRTRTKRRLTAILAFSVILILMAFSPMLIGAQVVGEVIIEEDWYTVPDTVWVRVEDADLDVPDTVLDEESITDPDGIATIFAVTNTPVVWPDTVLVKDIAGFGYVLAAVSPEAGLVELTGPPPDERTLMTPKGFGTGLTLDVQPYQPTTLTATASGTLAGDVYTVTIYGINHATGSSDSETLTLDTANSWSATTTITWESVSNVDFVFVSGTNDSDERVEITAVNKLYITYSYHDIDVATISATSGPEDVISVDLSETGPNTGVFRGSFDLVVGVTNDEFDELHSVHCDTIKATYEDADPTATVTDEAGVDDEAPTISEMAPGGYVTDAKPTISAKLADDKSGIDVGTVVMTVDGAEVTLIPTIDGILSLGEWDAATTFSLDDAYTVYVMNDGEYLYVAFDYAVTTGSDFASFNTYKEGAFEPETITAPCVTPWGPVWDTIVDEDPLDGVPETWHREDPTTRYECSVSEATEMKVPLSELHIEAGDTVKMIFVLNVEGVGPFVYPEGADSFDLTTYADLTLAEILITDALVSYTPIGLVDGAHTVTVDVSDLAGNPADMASWSFTVDITPPTIPATTLTSPNGGEFWAGGSTQAINWAHTDIMDDNLGNTPISLYYSTDSGATWTLIIAGLENNGSWAYWTVPSLDIDTARVNITATDLAGNSASDISDADFTIDNTLPVVTITYPLNGTYVKIEAGNRIWVNGTAFDINNATCMPAINLTEFTCVSYDDVTGEFAIGNTTAIPDGYLAAEVSFTDLAGLTGEDEVQFYVDNTPPTAPTGLNVTAVPGAMMLEWTAATDPPDGGIFSGVANYTIYRNDTILETIGNVTTYIDTSIELEPGVDYYYNVTATDVAGNEGPRDINPIKGWATFIAGVPYDVEVTSTSVFVDTQSLSANEVYKRGECWINPKYAFVSDDQYAAASWGSWEPEKGLRLVLGLEDPVDIPEGAIVTSVVLRVEQRIVNPVDDYWGFAVKVDGIIWFTPSTGTTTDSVLTFDLSYRLAGCPWDAIEDIAFIAQPLCYDTEWGGWYIDHVWIEVGYSCVADVPALLADGVSTCTITADVTDEYGRPVNGTEVTFETTAGTVYPTTATTNVEGIATATLTASTTVETANVTATADTAIGWTIVEFVSDTYDISLSVGWNLISLPIIPADETIEVVSNGLDVGIANVEVVWGYEAAYLTDGLDNDGDTVVDEADEAWLVYTPGPAPDTLTKMEDGKGYWIKMSAPATLTVYGFEVQVGPGVSPPTYSVVEGWNLIGFKSKTTIEAVVYLSGIEGKWVSLWTYGPGGWVKVLATEEMTPGRGYWIYMTEAGTIVP